MYVKDRITGSDKRFAPRRKRRLPGVLYVEGNGSGVRCVIVDVSTTGMRVQIDGASEAVVGQSEPGTKRVRLVDLGEKVTYDCVVVRSLANELGLHFAAPPILPAVAPLRRRIK